MNYSGYFGTFISLLGKGKSSCPMYHFQTIIKKNYRWFDGNNIRDKGLYFYQRVSRCYSRVSKPFQTLEQQLVGNNMNYPLYYIYAICSVCLMWKTHRSVDGSWVQQQVVQQYIILAPLVANGISYLTPSLPKHNKLKWGVVILCSLREWV